MINLVDSSGWFEYFFDSPNARDFTPIIEDTDHLIVSPITFYEIYRKIRDIGGEDESNRAIGFLLNGRVVDLNQSIALNAAILSKTYHLHLADSLLLATAQFEDATLWTMHAHFKDIPGVRYISKVL